MRARFVVSLLLVLSLGTNGCHSALIKDPDDARAGALVARVEIIQGTSCPGLASVAQAPEHCAWPSSSDRSLIEAVVFRVVAHVGADGHAASVQVIDAPPGFDAAAADCAMRFTYRPVADETSAPGASDSCPVTVRLARYVSDINPRGPANVPCPVVRSPFSQAREWPGTCSE
jgi:hypothetical protein